jgi:hypothetical protein
MNLVQALGAEETRLRKRLSAIQHAISALGESESQRSHLSGKRVGRRFSAEVRARMSKKAKERWSKWRAERAKPKRAA